MLQQEMNRFRFHQLFEEYGRGENFSYEGLDALYDFLEDSFETLDIDAIALFALCCDFNEYQNLEEFHTDYDEENFSTMDNIEAMTIVIPVNDEGFIIQAF